jgi:hypothetical protein
VTSVLIGRGAELARLRELVGEVAAGRGRSVLVEGEPGIGKSSLIAAGIEGAAGLGCRVLRGAADEFTGRFPLRVLLDCFAGYECGDVAALVRGEWGGVAGGSYDPVLAAMERLLEAVDKLCAGSPVRAAAKLVEHVDMTVDSRVLAVQPAGAGTVPGVAAGGGHVLGAGPSRCDRAAWIAVTVSGRAGGPGDLSRRSLKGRHGLW